MRGIEGKNVIVSAGGSGLGRAIALVLSGYGANVTVFSRSEKKLSETVEEGLKRNGRRINAVAADLSKEEDIHMVLESVHARFGGIDALVMNYGDPIVAPFMDISASEWDYSINMMLRSTLLLTKSACRDMMEKKGGRIVYVTSMMTKSPAENFSISASLRSAIIGLGKVLSIELGPKGINVNSISQGYFLTERLRNIARQRADKEGVSYEGILEGMKESVPLRRFGKPEELGELVAFLCSDESAYLTGTNIQIDGGVIKFPF